MFSSFTGSSKRPRQINLSGRNVNPFAFANPGGNVQDAVATAQQERLNRQRERERHTSTRTIQRVWRGHRCRRELREEFRQRWDAEESIVGTHNDIPYPTSDICISQLRGLLRFVNLRVGDYRRFNRFMGRLLASDQPSKLLLPAPHKLISRLLDLLLEDITIKVHHNFAPGSLPDVTFSGWPALQLKTLDIVIRLYGFFPTPSGAIKFYSTLSAFATQEADFLSVISDPAFHDTSMEDLKRLLGSSIMFPLTNFGNRSLNAYKGFILGFLTLKNNSNDVIISDVLSSLVGLLQSNGMLENFCRQLALVVLDTECRTWLKQPDNVEGGLWLLGRVIQLFNSQNPPALIVATEYIEALTLLLGSFAGEISARAGKQEDTHSRVGPPPSKKHFVLRRSDPLPPYIAGQLASLLDQRLLGELLGRVSESNVNGQMSDQTARKQAWTLASYAIVLIRTFETSADQLKVWIYLSSISTPTIGQARLPALKYFWLASRNSEIFTSIMENDRSALTFLKSQVKGEDVGSEESKDFRVVLLFLEIYSFVLKITDDDEFFSAGSTVEEHSANSELSWMRRSALPLKEIRDLTIFLKNLAFSMYWNASEIDGSTRGDDASNLTQLFHSPNTSDSTAAFNNSSVQHTLADPSVAEIDGVTISYVKSVVTSLLRIIYDRDSRRRFLPPGHWLMTSKFDMEGFIADVVAEEEKRRELEDDDDDDEDNVDPEDNQQQDSTLPVASDWYLQTRIARAVKRADSPRLGILQNMPFFIPFEIRVHIFRLNVYNDQSRRRNGAIDPDAWRMSVLEHPSTLNRMRHQAGQDVLTKHHAVVRRQRVFGDAYKHFFDLGDGLKEPIQITFVDKFGTAEAGIDGGGVTKEFLISVTNEALNPSYGLFNENQQHLLYPNPAIIERLIYLEKKYNGSERLLPKRILKGTAASKTLRQYEFLGRVIGKCLYEGILIDVGFVGFFLLKWALTSNSGATPRESSYRASINDLKDLDEELYQGLLKLKNYKGNVEEFGQDFTITDESRPSFPGDPDPTRFIIHNLKPNGSQILVTNETRIEYIYLVARHRLQLQPALQTNRFLKGLSTIINPSWLAMFNQNELQTLVSGTAAEIDVADLRRNTQYGGIYVIGDDGLEHPTIKLFWDLMRALSDKERRKVLKFVTSTPRAPLLGFSQLQPHFSIRDAGTDQTRLPSTSTCVNLLKLPRYESADTLREKLLYAVNSGAGFDLS